MLALGRLVVSPGHYNQKTHVKDMGKWTVLHSRVPFLEFLGVVRGAPVFGRDVKFLKSEKQHVAWFLMEKP